MLFTKRQLQNTKCKNTKAYCKTTRGIPSQIDHLRELKPCFTFFVIPFNVNVVGDGYPVRQPFVTNSFAVEMELTEMQDLALITFQSLPLDS